MISNSRAMSSMTSWTTVDTGCEPSNRAVIRLSVSSASRRSRRSAASFDARISAFVATLRMPAIPADAIRMTTAPTTNSSLSSRSRPTPWVTCQWATMTDADAPIMKTAAIG